MVSLGVARWEPGSQSRLEEAALTLFSERGYEQTTVLEIATRAGVTERTFYRHFADKREVLFSGAATLQQIMVEAVGSAPAGATAMDLAMAALEAAGALLQQVAHHAAQRHAVISATPELYERELIKMATLGAAISEAIRSRGVDDPAASLAAEAGVTIFRVSFERWVHDPEVSDLGELMRDSLAELRVVTTPR